VKRVRKQTYEFGVRERERLDRRERDELERRELGFEVVGFPDTSVCGRAEGRAEGRLDAGAFASNGDGDCSGGFVGEIDVNAF
jgi:hypothetical protein